MRIYIDESGGFIVPEEPLNLTDRHAPRVERQDLVIEACEAALVSGNQPGLEAALAIARHLDRQRAVVGEDRFATRRIAMMGRVVTLHATWRIPAGTARVATIRCERRRFHPADVMDWIRRGIPTKVS